ncbi:MAG: EAL domain-containing protein [Lachnospiraceae bacterium]|nr:EAL domain-containing protein [Lachnospiraceae bacterium]
MKISVNSLLILIGACLMVFNIVRYRNFMKASGKILDGNQKLLRWRTSGFILLTFFLIGYIAALFRATSLMLALVLFFGSIYVYVAMLLMMELVGAQGRMMDAAVTDASDTEVKTGMYNLNGFSRHAKKVISARPGKQFMVIQWDLDEFKLYNDLNGYQNGDLLLKGIGQNSPKKIRQGLVFGHLSSDHFVLLAEKTETAVKEIYQAIEGMLNELNGGESLSFHMGMCAVTDPEEAVESLCDHALIALRTIKGQYQERTVWYEPGMRDSIVEENRLAGEMESALASGQFQVWYQPQINYKTGTISGAEALVRWIHPENGIIPPIKFIPLFEKNGFITKLDHYIWDRVCAFLRSWIDSGREPCPVSVNISRRDIYSDDLVRSITSLTDKYSLDPSLLHLEITESVYMASPEKMNRIVETLKSKGFTVEIDDFGSGYSSLNVLKDMKVNTLKLDMKFLEHSENSDRSGRIISAMIRMADWLDIGTIAEGVETKEQADFLKSMGCVHLQGYYFYKPMREEEYRELLAKKDIALREKHPVRNYLKGSLDFMDSSAQTTLVFNSFTGNAMIADYHDGSLELLRVNDQLVKLSRDRHEEIDLFRRDLLKRLAPDQQSVLREAMDRALAEQEETGCEIRIEPFFPGQEPCWLDVRMRVISTRDRSAVIYFTLMDTTSRWKMERLKKELETIFRNVPAGILTFEFDEDGKISYRYISGRVYEIFGLKAEDYRSGEMKNSLKLGITPEMVRELLKDTSRGIHFFEKQMSRSDGSGIWLQFDMLIKDEDGRKTGYAALNDVSEYYEKNAQQAAIMKAMPGGFMRYSCDEKEEVTYISEGLLELLDCSREEYAQFYDNRFSTMVCEEDRERVLGEINAQIGENGEWDMCKYRILTKGGRKKWVYDAAYVTADSDGRRWFNVVILDLDKQFGDECRNLT